MTREYWIVEPLQGRTPLLIPTPVFVAQQVCCYGYQKIPGTLLTDEYYWTLTLQQKRDLAVNLAQFLSELHGQTDLMKAAAQLDAPDDPLSSRQLRQRLLPLLKQSQHILLVEQIL